FRWDGRGTSRRRRSRPRGRTPGLEWIGARRGAGATPPTRVCSSPRCGRRRWRRRGRTGRQPPCALWKRTRTTGAGSRSRPPRERRWPQRSPPESGRRRRGGTTDGGRRVRDDVDGGTARLRETTSLFEQIRIGFVASRASGGHVHPHDRAPEEERIADVVAIPDVRELEAGELPFPLLDREQVGDD